jgi:AcrR family transcriptional regulator
VGADVAKVVGTGAAAAGQRAGGRREAVVEEAARLFLERGYHAASMRELARRLGVSLGTLYHYVPSKVDLLVEIHDSFIEGLLARLEGVAASSLPPQEKLRQFLRAQMEAIEGSQTRVAAFLRERRALPPEAAARLQPKRDRVDQILEGILREGVEAGAFRQVPLKSARLAILGMANWAVEWFRPGGPQGARELADDFADLVLGGLLVQDAGEA